MQYLRVDEQYVGLVPSLHLSALHSRPAMRWLHSSPFSVLIRHEQKRKLAPRGDYFTLPVRLVVLLLYVIKSVKFTGRENRK